MIPADALPVRLIQIHDGDTLKVGFPVPRDDPDSIQARWLRLLNVWAPEVVGVERDAGIAALVWAAGWLRMAIDEGGAWPLRVRLTGARSFDRWIANVWRVSDGDCLNDSIVEAGYATRTRAGRTL